MRQKKNRISDEALSELMQKIQKGDHSSFDLLCGLYDPLLCSMAASAHERYKKFGSEYEDLKQEAALALYKAAMSFHTEQRGVTFGLYAKICVRNRLISAGRRLIRQHGAKTAALQKEMASQLSSGRSGVLRTPDLTVLSDYERRVYERYIEGISYAQIAKMLGKPEKSVDNAICRIRRKLREQNH